MPARHRQGLSENTRQRIKTTMIVKRLLDHIDDKIDLKPTQIRAAEILLRKVLPDVQAISHDVSGTVTHASELTDGALLAFLNEQRAKALSADVSDAEIVQETPRIEAKSADAIPADIPECVSDAAQAPSRHDPGSTNTNTAGTGKKRRSRPCGRPGKVEL